MKNILFFGIMFVRLFISGEGCADVWGGRKYGI